VKYISLHCTIAVSHAHWTFQSQFLSLKVVFLFQSFLVINVSLLFSMVNEKCQEIEFLPQTQIF